MAITPFSAVPSRATGQDTFSADVETFWGQLPTFVNEVNAFGAGLSSQITTSSTTSLLVGTGSKTLTVGTGLGFKVGYPVRIAYSNSIHMTGTVTSYNQTTGVLICNIATVSGSGTYAVWSVYAIPASITNVPDGDKGDITVSASGATWTIDSDAVTFAKIQNIATSKLLGRTTAGSGDVEELSVGSGLRLSGGVLNSDVLKSGVSVSASGTAIDFTGLPSGIKRIVIILSGVSTNGTSNPLIQLGDSGGIENTGYGASAVAPVTGGATVGANYTTGFGIASNNSTAIVSGIMTLVNVTGNEWVSSHSTGFNTTNAASLGGGNKTLSATLDRLRITTVNGSDSYDAGTINILYE